LNNDTDYDFGHAALGYLFTAKVNQKLHEDRYLISDSPSNFSCNPPALSKYKHKVPKPVESTLTELFELIHTDVCGPFSNEYYGGSKYFSPSLMISRVSYWYSFLNQNPIPQSRFAHYLTILKDNLGK
jgi:hypothetical protein